MIDFVGILLTAVFGCAFTILAYYTIVVYLPEFLRWMMG